VTTIGTPTAGTLTLRLTVTDNAGAVDTADVTVSAPTSGGAVVTPAAAPAPASGGGGRLDALLLLALTGLALRGILRA
jgi:hypothetical protein